MMRGTVALTSFAALAALASATTAGCSSSAEQAVAGKGVTGAGGGRSAAAKAAAPKTAVASRAPSTPVGGSGSVAACSLLSAQQATTLNHVTYRAQTPASPTSWMDTCTYKNAGSADPVDIQDLVVTVMSVQGCWSQLKSSDGPGTAISGVGDAAFGAQIGIDFEAGNRCVTIRGLTHAELLGNYAPDIAMAKIILAKLR